MPATLVKAELTAPMIAAVPMSPPLTAEITELEIAELMAF